MKSIGKNVTFHKNKDDHRTAFEIISDKGFDMLNGLSIPSGICLYKNKMDERNVPEPNLEKTFTNKCIAEGLSYITPKTSRKTLNFKKSKLPGSKSSNKKKTK